MLPIKLHKAIQEKSKPVNRPIPIAIGELARELKIKETDLKHSIDVLHNLQIIEVDLSNKVLRLTKAGLLANLD
jgi:hypothetical protein